MLPFFRERKPLRVTSMVKQFIQIEAAGGLLLFIATLLALLIANSPIAVDYAHILQHKFMIGFEGFVLKKPILLWINDGLMALFFLMVGLEIKREIVEGELSNWSQVVLPFASAIGGILVPILIYTAVNYKQPSQAGWPVPIATDLAFALGLLSFLSNRIPLSLKVFLIGLSIIDDISAILITAVFFTEKVRYLPLLFAVGAFAMLIRLNLTRNKYIPLYFLWGIIMWVCVLKAGIHPTITGILTAITIPLGNKGGHSPLHKLEQSLHPWVTFFVLPLFALANTGIQFEGSFFDNLKAPVSLGIILGLFLGKQIGVFSTAYVLIKLGIAKLPRGSTLKMLYGMSALSGIGFTMSLFIANLAFQDHHDLMSAKFAVLIASICSATLSFCLLWGCCPRPPSETPSKLLK